MPAAEMLENGLLLTAFLLVVSGFLLKRSARRQTVRKNEVTPLSCVDSAIKRIEACEARLNDHSRATDASFDMRAALLRELITQADEASIRLESQVDPKSHDGRMHMTNRRVLTERLLRQAGYSEEQAAKLAGRLLEDEGFSQPIRHAA